eukprot:547889_1
MFLLHSWLLIIATHAHTEIIYHNDGGNVTDFKSSKWFLYVDQWNGGMKLHNESIYCNGACLEIKTTACTSTSCQGGITAGYFRIPKNSKVNLSVDYYTTLSDNIVAYTHTDCFYIGYKCHQSDLNDLYWYRTCGAQN